MGHCVPQYVPIAAFLVFNAVVVTTAPISGTNNENGKHEVTVFHPRKELNEEVSPPYRDRNITELMAHHFLMTDKSLRTDLPTAEFDHEREYTDSPDNDKLYRTRNRNILNTFIHVAKRQFPKRRAVECNSDRITVEMLIRFFKTGHLCSTRTVRFRFGVAK